MVAAGRGYCASRNVAVAVLLVLIDTMHTPVPVQAPLQPWNAEVPPGVAVSRTVAPLA